MKRWINVAVAMAAVVAFVGFAYAAVASMSGEVTKYDLGKSISMKDAKGKEHTLHISKDTKVEGEIKIGAKVTVEAEGKNAQSIKAPAAN